LKKHISKGKSEKTFYFVTKIIQDIKKFTARESNKILNRNGIFWQNESYDHAIRNKKELLETVKYVLNNPVKAGLCVKSKDWEWNYFNPKFLDY
jgi:REP element-mobilizing transposase RayT